MPTKLRMKHDDPLDSIHKAAKKARKRAHRQHAAKEHLYRQESLTPPRATTSGSSAAKHKYDFVYEDPDFDESTISPDQARKKAYREEEEHEEERWRAKLQAAEWDDRGIGAQEDALYSTMMPSTGFSYGGAAGLAMGANVERKPWLETMDEEEYAEHIRAGMWFRKNKEAVEAMERKQKYEKEKREREEEELEEARREEKKRIRKLEEQGRKRKDEEAQLARKNYEEKWKKLLATAKVDTASIPTPAPTPPSGSDAAAPAQHSTSHPKPLRYTDFAWPIFPPFPLPPLSWPATSDLSPGTVSLFLFSHLPSPTEDPQARKQALRTAVLQYHPDRFERLVGRIKEDDVDLKERVRELALRTSQVLNELNSQT